MAAVIFKAFFSIVALPCCGFRFRRLVALLLGGSPGFHRNGIRGALGELSELTNVILKRFIRDNNADAGHVLDERGHGCEVNILDVSVGQPGVIGHSGKVVAVDVDESRDALAVEGLADDVEKRAYRHGEKVGLVAGKSERANAFVAELDEVGKNGLAYLGVIPRDNGVGVELPGAAGAGQLERCGCL